MSIALIALSLALAGAMVALARARSRNQLLAAQAEGQKRDLNGRFDSADTQRAVFLQIMNGLGEGLLAIDRQRRVVLANRRFIEMLGGGDPIGKPVSEVIRVAAVFTAFDSALGGEESSQRFSLAERKIELRAFPLPSNDIAAVALFIDVTRLERLEETRRNFISDFSHEVRTPLAGLRSAVESFEIAADRISPEDEQQLRKIMQRQLRRLERLVDDIGELNRIESGDLTLERGEVNLRALLTELGEEFAERAAQRSLRLSITGDGVPVCGDAMRLQQAFANLVDNAIKYGGENNTIDISIEDGVVRISDHGEGIAQEETERIFRRFYRIDRSRSQEIAGTGLGLAITKHLILLHRGTIAVESEPGKRSTFIITLPRA